MLIDRNLKANLTAAATFIACGLATNNVNADLVENCSSSVADAVIPSNTVNVVSLNISHGRKTALNQLLVSRERTISNIIEIAEFLDKTNADVVALQEADGPSSWSGKFDHVAYLLENSDYTCAIHGRQAKTRFYQFGTALMARQGLDERRSLRFEPSPPTTTKGLVSATISLTVDGTLVPITVVSVHLDFARKKVRDSQIAEMVSHVSGIDTPLIVMGDFNSEWQAERSHVRRLAETLALSAYEPESEGLGTYKTTSGKRLDWILISSHLEIIAYRVLPDVHSDHLAVFAEIRHRGEL